MFVPDYSSIVIAEGFLVLYDEETVREMDSRFFVREDYETLKRRRQDRHGYVSELFLSVSIREPDSR
jgi:uridine kinase